MSKHDLQDVHDKLDAGVGPCITTDSTYQYTHSHQYDNGQVLEGISFLLVDDANPFPKDQDLNLVQIIEIAEAALALVANIVINLTNLLDIGSVNNPGPTVGEVVDAAKDITKAIKDIEEKAEKLRKIIAFCKGLITSGAEKAKPESHSSLLSKVSVFVIGQLEKKAGDKSSLGAGSSLQALLKEIAEFIFGAVVQSVLRDAGLYGKATSVRQFAEQFQSIVVPNSVSNADNDDAFAALQVAGPNPLVIRRVIDRLPKNFRVENASYQRVMGEGDSIALAIAENRLYYADYHELSKMVPGTFPEQKYISAPFALFAVSKGDTAGTLKSVAIQLRQTPSSNNPVFYPFHEDAWPVAKLHVQTADANYHELISHLGLTHLLLEPIAVSTHRMLSEDHPLFTLLLPHIQGTLFINNAAILTLINPGGSVDSLLGGTIESDWAVVAGALGELDFNARMLPNQLADRFVANQELPLAYPYRDDALDVWQATREWVSDYLAIYYPSDSDVINDKALQAWVQDLISTDGGNIGGLGERMTPNGDLGIYTVGYLTDVLTMAVFTASAQHAAVNFPQLTVMSYTPAMQMASYAPLPTSEHCSSSQDILATLPPLEQSLKQMLLTQLLGGVYFTRLGDYNRHQRGNYFQNTQVQGALDTFRDRLDKVEQRIGKRNLTRPTYETLLPSRIPQSINI
ncbi:hypothetical protein A9Q99_20945 [Gammaproteobacteria bacterium 45_16_T64]|nr:hypothetical protein A9Q99_20945 [Gammaproteobacteria bacterium 45_16_T64]